MNDKSFESQLKKNASQTKFSGVPTPEGPQGQVGKGYMDYTEVLRKALFVKLVEYPSHQYYC